MNNTNTTSPHPRLFVRWFVQYNPLFTASALCVLGGVLLLSCAMGPRADVGLTAVLELYQALVIGAAALLYRRLLERRPAAILGVIALVFLVDPTLQLGALAASGEVLVSAAWVVLFALKWRALAWAFRLRLSTSLRLLPPLAAAVVAAVPHVRVYELLDDRELSAAIAVLVFAFGCAFSLWKPKVESRQALGDVGALMFPRLVRAAAVVAGAGAAYQLWNATLQIGAAAWLPAIGAVLLVVAVRTQKEGLVYALSFGAFLLTAASGDAGMHVGVPLVAAALLLASRHSAPRVFVTGLVVAYAAVAVPAMQAHVTVSPALVVAGAVVTLALVYLLRTRKAWSAIGALLLVNARPLAFLARVLVDHGPHRAGEWGGVLLAAGFTLLPLGIYLHRRFSRALAVDDAARDMQPALEGGPSSPAAIAS
jgi:hypothetical protein